MNVQSSGIQGTSSTSTLTARLPIFPRRRPMKTSVSETELTR